MWLATSRNLKPCMMADRAPDASSSLRSSITEDDLEEARRRLLADDQRDDVGSGSYAPHHGHRYAQYGSVATGNSSRKRAPRSKRYRLPFLILLAFDWGLVVFLSIICAEKPLSGGGGNQTTVYFDLNIHTSFFDLVVIATFSTVLNVLFYLVLGWITRIIMALTTLASALYVPIKAYYAWGEINDDDEVPEIIAVLLILFVSFAVPWLIAFFFEFKYLPSELSRLQITSWWDWKAWLWPRALIREESDETPSLPDVADPLPPPSHRILPRPIPTRSDVYTASSLSLDYRTPLGSSRASPVPPYDRDEVLLPIREEASPPIQLSPPLPEYDLSPEDIRFKQEGEEALQALQALTRSNAGWTLVKSSGGIQCYSKPGRRRKIFKGECIIEIGIRQLWNVLHPGEKTPEWSPQCALNEVIYRVDEYTDVLYTVSTTMGPVSSRDFVSVRQIVLEDGCYYSASMATATDMKPPQRGKVRAENGPCGYALVPLDANRTQFIWVLNSDLKGWLPQAVIDQSLSGTLIGSCQKLQEYITCLRLEGRLNTQPTL